MFYCQDCGGRWLDKLKKDTFTKLFEAQPELEVA
jgi:hypothetical protein